MNFFYQAIRLLYFLILKSYQKKTLCFFKQRAT